MPITVLNPTSLSEVQPGRLAAALASLKGCAIGVVDNGKLNSDRILRRVGAMLVEQCSVREIVWRRKHEFSRPAPSGLLAELRGCDAIIAGIGD
ncbi:MAG TPA: hypothetical protein VF937_00460 [Chloroflexota bacterium]